MATNQYGVVQKRWLTAFVLSLILGWLGADRFYLGKAGTAVLKLLTLGGLGVWALIDFILIATRSMKGVEWINDQEGDKKKASIIFAVVLLLGVVSIAATPESQNIQTSSSTPTNSTPEAPQESEKFAFDDGKHEIGKDIQPGTYRTKGGDGSSFGCYWARLKGFSGELDDIIANNGSYNNGSQIITIAATDEGFETRGCGKWYAELTQVTSNKTSFGDGMLLVGTDIEPGTYKNTGAKDQYSCYWARLKDFSGELSDIVANEIGGNTLVTIAATDKGFSSSGCGDWAKQ